MSARYLKYIIYLPIWKNMTSPPTRARSATTSNSLWSSAWILSKTAGFRTSTMWKSKELVKRLTPFVAPGDAALMERHLYIDSRVKAINEGVYISVDLCHAAPSQHSRIRSSGYCLDSSSRNMFIQVELQYGITREQELPVTGSTAPYAYRYSRMWWQGTDGRMPFSHQQYLGLLIRPNPASSWNISRTS